MNAKVSAMSDILSDRSGSAFSLTAMPHVTFNKSYAHGFTPVKKKDLKIWKHRYQILTNEVAW